MNTKKTDQRGDQKIGRKKNTHKAQTSTQTPDEIRAVLEKAKKERENALKKTAEKSSDEMSELARQAAAITQRRVVEDDEDAEEQRETQEKQSKKTEAAIVAGGGIAAPTNLPIASVREDHQHEQEGEDEMKKEKTEDGDQKKGTSQRLEKEEQEAREELGEFLQTLQEASKNQKNKVRYIRFEGGVLVLKDITITHRDSIDGINTKTTKEESSKDRVENPIKKRDISVNGSYEEFFDGIKHDLRNAVTSKKSVEFTLFLSTIPTTFSIQTVEEE